MRLLLLPILILLFAGCISAEKLKEVQYKEGLFTIPFGATESTYATSYGDIKEGYTKDQVKAILGDPQYISTDPFSEYWYYEVGEDKGVFVHFSNGRVTAVKDREDVE